MKFKYFFLALMVLVLASSAVFAAEQATIGDYTFYVPDEFNVTNASHDLVSLQKDNDHAIVLFSYDEAKDPDEFKADLESQGYVFGEEANYTAYDFPVEQINYNKDNYQGFLYICHLGDDDVVYITYVIPSDEDVGASDNPVDAILKSMAD